MIDGCRSARTWLRAIASQRAALATPEGYLDRVLMHEVAHGIGPAFARLATEGSRPEIEQDIGSAVDGAVRYVLALYALLIIIAFLGVTKIV